MFKDSDNHDNADLSDVVVGENRYIPIVDSFTYLSSVVTRNCADESDVDTRIKKAGNIFGSIRKSNCVVTSEGCSLQHTGTSSIAIWSWMLELDWASYSKAQDLSSQMSEDHVSDNQAAHSWVWNFE